MKYAPNYYLYVDKTSIALSRWELHFEGTVMVSQFSATTVCGKIWQSERSGLHFEARGKISRLCRVYYEAEQEKLSRMPIYASLQQVHSALTVGRKMKLKQDSLSMYCSLLKKRSLRQPFEATQSHSFSMRFGNSQKHEQLLQIQKGWTIDTIKFGIIKSLLNNYVF